MKTSTNHVSFLIKNLLPIIQYFPFFYVCHKALYVQTYMYVLRAGVIVKTRIFVM
jgi:hypothetical protein